MRFISKAMLIVAVSIIAVAMAAMPSEAATKKKKKRVAAPPPAAAEVMPIAATGCGDGGFCASNCSPSGCQVNICGADKQWHPAILTPFCITGQCPPRC